MKSGHLAGYAGDVWFPQPSPKSHPWRTMPNHGMTPHISGTTLSAQARFIFLFLVLLLFLFFFLFFFLFYYFRYAAGTREILENFFDKKPIRDEYLIVQDGKLAGTGAHSYSEGNATGGSEEAAEFKKGK